MGYTAHLRKPEEGDTYPPHTQLKQPLRKNPSIFYQSADACSVASSCIAPSAGTGKSSIQS